MALRWPRMPEIRLSATDFDQQLEHDGRDTLVRRAIACSCYDDETRQPNPNCTKCSGWGMVYDSADELTVKVLWQAHNADLAYRMPGTLITGTTRVTWPSQYALGHGVIFVSPLEESVVDNELLKRGELDPQGESLERLRHRLITGIEQIRYGDTLYVEGVDYQRVGQRIGWITAGPPAGRLYAVRYRHRTEFVIDGDEPQMREDGDRLCYTCMVRRFPSVNRQAGDALGQT